MFLFLRIRRRGSRRSARQRIVISLGLFKFLLELQRYWRDKGCQTLENREGVYQHSALAKRMASVSEVGGSSE